MKESYSTSEVAKFCHVTADTIRKWAEAGRINVFKTPGGHRRIRHDELLFFLRDNGIPVSNELIEENMRVLVIGDELSMISAIGRFLEQSSCAFDINIAEDAFQAGHLLATLQPHVVFLGLNMDGLNGWDACRRIKEDIHLPGTRVIAVAREWSTQDSKRIFDNGAAACLSNPFTPDELRRVLARIGFEIG